MSEPPPPPPTPRVKVDLVDGSQGKLDAFGWLEKQAIIRVSALPGAALHTSGDDVAFNALAAATAAGYTVDSAHPQCAALLLSGERSVAVKHASLAEISVTYRRPGADNRIIPRSLPSAGRAV